MDEDRVRAAEAVARAWKEMGIPYLVMHGLERYPDSLGRDLDILMSSRFAGRALEGAATVLSGLGWSIACPPPLWGRRLVALKRDMGGTFQYLELHTMSSLRWAALTLVDEDEHADGSVGPFRVSSWATFAKTVLTPLLARDLARFDSDYLAGLGVPDFKKDLVKERLFEIFGSALSQKLASAVEALDVDGLRGLARPLRIAAIRQILRHPVRSCSILPRFMIQKAGRLVSSSGLRARMIIPPLIDVEPIVNDVVDHVRRVFVTVDVSRARSLLQRVEQQYRTMSRQGLVLDLEEFSADATSIVIVAKASRYGLTSAAATSFSPSGEDDPAGQIARWLIEQWRERYACLPGLTTTNRLHRGDSRHRKGPPDDA